MSTPHNAPPGGFNMNIRRAGPDDAEALRDLYFNHLCTNPPQTPQDMAAWRDMLARFAADSDYHILAGETGGKIVSSVTVVVLENLPHDLRPYALIENVVTRVEYRGRGFARTLMNRACDIARARGCYKIMLLTGTKKDSTLRFYENCGFNKNDKTGFVQWL